MKQTALFILAFGIGTWQHLAAQSLVLINNTPNDIELRLELMQPEGNPTLKDSVMVGATEKKTIDRKGPYVAFYRVVIKNKPDVRPLDFIWDEDAICTVDSAYRMAVTGSRLTDEYDEFNRTVTDPARRIMIENTIQSNILRQKGDSALADSALVKNNVLVYETNKKTDSLTLTGKRDFLNLYRLNYAWDGLGVPATKKVLSEFDSSWHDHPIYKSISKQVERIENNSEGTEVPSFTRNSLAGSVINLSEIRSKYILLDFWGSWCKPCIEAIPKLKEMVAKYQADELSIIGIASESALSSSALKKIIKARDITWTQIEELMVAKDNLVNLYGITFFPTYILLDEKLVVLKRGGPEVLQDIEGLLRK